MLYLDGYLCSPPSPAQSRQCPPSRHRSRLDVDQLCVDASWVILAMPPALEPSKSLVADTITSNPAVKTWQENRKDTSTSLHGRGQENAPTSRYTLEQRTDSRRRSSERIKNRHRQNSLKRVKNSNEVLRQRSTKKVTKDSLDPATSTREPRHFTVANVGDNGKIYLRHASALLIGCNVICG